MDELKTAEHKEHIRKQWNNTPCGKVGDITYDLDYFIKVEKNRYDSYAPWMKSFYQYNSNDNNEVSILEVGFGQGTDLVQFAKAGAKCTGIDYTPKHFELAQLNFQLRGLEADLRLGDASDLPFEDNSFDKVYSFGVLHHTPDIEKCIDEVYRVLKPGGVFVMSLYHKNSLFHYYTKVFLEGILRLRFLTLGYMGVMATLEEGADGKKIKPLVNVYNESSLKPMLSKFKNTEYHIRHLRQRDIPILGSILSQNYLDKLQTKYGWYIISKSTK